MPLDIFADDDALYASGTNTPMLGSRPPVTVSLSKYRGPGTVKVQSAVRLDTVNGGKPDEPGTANVTFGEPGEYVIHVQANDYSGNGGGGAGCCWTTALVKVCRGYFLTAVPSIWN